MSRRRNWQCGIVAAVMVASVASVCGAQDSTAALSDTTGVLRGGAGAGARSRDQDEAQRERLKETLQRMGRREVQGRRQWQRRKSGKVAMLSSALLPGLGQLYNGRRIKVAVMAGVASTYVAQIWLNQKAAQRARATRDRLDPGSSDYRLQNRLSEFYEDEARTWVWWTGAVWIIGILDAWTDAHLYDIRVYTPPSEDELSGVYTEMPREGPVHYLTMSLGF